MLLWFLIAVFPGIVLLAVGVGILYWAYGIARFSEQIDAIGAKRSSSAVEPAGWNVTLYRISGAMIAFIGAGWLLINVILPLIIALVGVMF